MKGLFGCKWTEESNQATFGEIAKAGADTFVAGTAIFGTSDYAATIKELKQKVAEVNDA